MKVLVFAGCSHLAYVHYLKAAHPDWDIRAVVPLQARKWVAERNEGFMTFLAELDILVGLTDHEDVVTHVGAQAVHVPVPSFGYYGHHPDVINLAKLPSMLERGLAHSRIAMAGWLSGLTLAETQALFCEETYERLGYFDKRDNDRTNILKVFSGRGLDITELFDSWYDRPGFLHYPAHPQTGFFMDVVQLAMERAGFPADTDAATLQAARDSLVDYLEDGVLWPVYPEIAARHGIAAIPPDWRSSAAKGQGEHFDLPEMLRRSFAIYDAHPDCRAAMETALGGPDQVASYVQRS